MATFQIVGAGNLDLINNAPTLRSVTTKVIHGWGQAAWAGTIAVLMRSRSNINSPWVAAPYRKRVLGVTAQIDETPQIATIVNQDFIIEVNSANMDIRLTTSAYTAGQMNIEEVDLEG
jgi:hypothetical protein